MGRFLHPVILKHLLLAGHALCIFAAAHCIYSLMTHSSSKSFTFFCNVVVFYKVQTKNLMYVCKLFEGCLNKLQVFKLLHSMY